MTAVPPAAVSTAFAIVVGALLALAGTWFAVFTSYYLVLAVAALFYRRPRLPARPTKRLLVVVPAHDEAALIARCVRSLKAQTYPAELYDVVVIADNCTDETAVIASEAGAEVLVRDVPDARGKGHALRWALERVDARVPPPDGIVIVDADSVADPEFLRALGAPFERGALAVQGESLLVGDSPAASLRAAAFLLVNRVRPAGRAVLGLASPLHGNGMLFSRELLRAHPWDAFTSAEDVEYAVKLRIAGIHPAFAGGAILESPTAPTAEAAVQQQLRWEGGKLHLARTYIPLLLRESVRRRDGRLLELAFELAVLPLGLLAAGSIIGTVAAATLVALDVVPTWVLGPWLVALLAIPPYVLIGLRAARAPASAYRALARAPGFVLTKALGAHRLFTFRAQTWVRTARARRDGD